MRDGFAIGDLRFTDVRLDAEFALHAIDDDLKVKFAHSGDDRLARFVVGDDLKRRIFLSKAVKSNAHLVLVVHGFSAQPRHERPVPESPSTRE